MSEEIVHVDEEAPERETDARISSGGADSCSQAIAVEQIDDGELPQRVKDCLKGSTSV